MKRAINRDVSFPSCYPGIFTFELDFSGSLRCIPMSVRLKLDQVGVKLSLKQWNKLPDEARRGLVESTCSDAAEVHAYREYLVGLIKQFTASVPEILGIEESPPWTQVNEIPERIVAWARTLGVPSPTIDRWGELTELQRFALFKLTRPGHSNDNFIPAMREFSLLG